jgi:putative membrane protein
MHTAANIVVGIVALIHVYILVLEMFLWEKPAGLRAFGLTKEFAAATRVLAGNQGLYNGFLAAGLIWGLFTGDISMQHFFLSCVLVAGVYGALTANVKILWVQAVPAMVALTLIWGA